ncbi:hypothetical protein M422DRAFT_58462 [Sphaerobolus stellatus SS14]|nr:hypothetical protein M422DRAFT_58462 [Sphaerobolus stellatus SS14]
MKLFLKHDGDVCIVQELIDRLVLEDVWHTLSPDQQRSSMVQLKDCLTQFHDTFHRSLGHDIMRKSLENNPLAQEALSRFSRRRYRTVFTHGDLGPHNLLWKDGYIIVIGWERSG